MSELHTRITFHVDKDIALDFRKAVKESGYTQTHLIQKAMSQITRDLKKKKLEELGGLFDEKQSE